MHGFRFLRMPHLLPTAAKIYRELGRTQEQAGNRQGGNGEKSDQVRIEGLGGGLTTADACCLLRPSMLSSKLPCRPCIFCVVSRCSAAIASACLCRSLSRLAHSPALASLSLINAAICRSSCPCSQSSNSRSSTCGTRNCQEGCGDDHGSTLKLPTCDPSSQTCAARGAHEIISHAMGAQSRYAPLDTHPL